MLFLKLWGFFLLGFYLFDMMVSLQLLSTRINTDFSILSKITTTNIKGK